jgi:hypothetical protein
MANKYFKLHIKGMNELRASLRKIANEARYRVARPLYQFAETKIANRARAEFVPVVTGALRSSIITQVPVISGQRISVTVGAGGPAAPYALSVHENPRSGITQGESPSGKKYYRRPGQSRTYSTVGGFKYLELPALEAVSNSGGLVKDIKSEMEKLAHASKV